MPPLVDPDRVAAKVLAREIAARVYRTLVLQADEVSDSVRGMGVSEFTGLVLENVRNKILEHPEHPPIKIPGPATLAPMTDAESRGFGKSPMPSDFERHAGRRVDEVSLSVLCEIADTRDEWQQELIRYLRSPRILAEIQSDDSES